MVPLQFIRHHIRVTFIKSLPFILFQVKISSVSRPLGKTVAREDGPSSILTLPEELGLDTAGDAGPGGLGPTATLPLNGWPWARD